MDECLPDRQGGALWKAIDGRAPYRQESDSIWVGGWGMNGRMLRGRRSMGVNLRVVAGAEGDEGENVAAAATRRGHTGAGTRVKGAAGDLRRRRALRPWAVPPLGNIPDAACVCDGEMLVA